jgi:hypothetical protein
LVTSALLNAPPSPPTSIGKCAFYRCTAVTAVTIPSAVSHILDLAFFRCTALTSVNIPSSVARIGTRAFYGCTALTAVTIPSTADMCHRAFPEETTLNVTALLWSPQSHARFPAAARARAVSLMLLGHALSRSGRFACEEVALFDVWVDVVMPFVVHRE